MVVYIVTVRNISCLISFNTLLQSDIFVQYTGRVVFTPSSQRTAFACRAIRTCHMEQPSTTTNCCMVYHILLLSTCRLKRVFCRSSSHWPLIRPKTISTPKVGNLTRSTPQSGDWPYALSSCCLGEKITPNYNQEDLNLRESKILHS